MDTHEIKKARGQILVIVTLMVIGVLAMLALVLDGGNLYSHRRAAQLAADAGALAGARAYCLSDTKNPGAAAAAAEASAEEYVILNDADLEDVTITDGDVKVDTSITFDTFFLGILGRNQLTAEATATAGCAPPSSGIGIMPIAWSCRPPMGDSDFEECDSKLMDSYEDDTTPNECVVGEDPIYMIVDSVDIEDEIVCMDDDTVITDTVGVTFVDCDIDDDGVDDLTPISGGNRSWLDLNGGGGGAADLKDWIENGIEEQVNIHTWFAGQTGVAVSVYDSTNDYQMGNDVIVPIFDLVCPYGVPSADEDNPCRNIFHEDVDTVVYDGGASTDFFHIISFAIFRIECVDAGGNPKGLKACPAHEAAGLAPQIKTIEGCFVEGFDPGLGAGGDSIDLGAEIIYLKK